MTTPVSLTEGTKALFIEYAKDADNWRGLNGRSKTPLVWLEFTEAGIEYAATLGIDLAWIKGG